MKIAFHSNQLSLRGTETALYDYADYNERLLGNISCIVTPRLAAGHHELSAQRFVSRFPVFAYDSVDQLDRVLMEQGADVLYCIKSGQNDGLVSKKVKTVVHSVFGYCEPHGDVYAYVSSWLSQYASQGKYPSVPHIVTPLPEVDDMRAELGIPRDAMVFGRHGGSDTFDIPFVKIVVEELARRRDDLYFLFLGTDVFCQPHPRIIHLSPSADVMTKSRFIHTCDAMLHARTSGETFGLSMAEFSALNKPIITYNESQERAHIEILGSNAFYYSDPRGLAELLLTFDRDMERNWRVYAETFTPESVMGIFKEVFLGA